MPEACETLTLTRQSYGFCPLLVPNVTLFWVLLLPCVNPEKKLPTPLVIFLNPPEIRPATFSLVWEGLDDDGTAPAPGYC